MKRSSPWLTAAFQFTLLISTIASASPWLENGEPTLPGPPRAADVALRAGHARPIYHGSVVPGGVYSAEELRDVMRHDPVVAAHYRDAAVGELRPVTLTAGRAAYVSYRVNDQVYWTRSRVWIRAGETVLTDGTTTVRARCGNCISDAQEGPVAAVDPAHGELDDFVVPPLDAGGVEGEAPPELANLLEVPFGPQMFVSALPPLPHIELEPFGPVGPLSGGVPFILPAGFVPLDTGTTSSTGTPTTGDLTTETTGGDTGSPTTGSVTGSPTTGDATGSPTTDGGSGSPTTGTPFFTTAVATTDSPPSTSRETPEPGTLWLLGTGVVGLASRYCRRR